jgi:hypothetical protein
LFCEIVLNNVKNSNLAILNIGGGHKKLVITTAKALYSPADILDKQKSVHETWNYLKELVASNINEL